MNTKRLGIEHFGYKIIALLIAMILWVTVVSHREMTMNQKVNVQFVVPTGFKIEGFDQIEITVQLSGPRPILKKFIDKYWTNTIVVPLRNPVVGPMAVEIPTSYFQLPPEVKVISITPREATLLVSRGTP